MECPTQVCKVVIVGAGISGLSAARHLIKNGIEEIVILEAKNKAGGRINTIEFGKGLVELGAQWIHGEQNEFCQLVKNSAHRHVKTSHEGKGDFLCPDGDRIEDDMVNEVLGWIEDKIEEIEGTFSIENLQQDGTPNTASMGQYLLDSFRAHLKSDWPEWEEDSSEHSLRMALFQWGMSFQRIDNSCNRMNDVSLYRWSEFQVNPGEHYNNFGRAQSFVDEILVSDLHRRIQFNSPVENILWENNNEDKSEHVKVTVEDGSTVLAETVIVTCSIACLKSNLESLFTPHLPERMVEAIRATGFGPVTKVFLEWDEPWWPSDLKGFQLVWPKEYIDCCEGDSLEKVKENWHKTITGFDPVLDNPNVLLVWLGGHEAVFVEGLGEDEIGRRCVGMLKKFTGLNVPEVKAVAVSRWNTNKFFQGAYSFRSVDGDTTPGDICSVLCEPVVVEDKNGTNKPVIVLAGEALSKTHYSTLHGAYEAGISQANKVVQYFARSKKLASLAPNSITKNVQNSSSGERKKVIHDNGERKEAISAQIITANSSEIKVPS